MQIVDKYGNTFGQGHLIVTSKSGKPKVPTVTVAWGNITGILSNQTDLQNALNLKVPTARTITINGNTQDLSADRTWTISTGITVNTTPITGGSTGRLLFDDAGVVGETNGVHWDKVNSRLGLGTATPTQTLDIQGDISIGLSAATTVRAYYNSTTRNQLIYTNTSSLEFFQSINERMRLAPGSGNLLLNTTTDAGFKLDVNGTARIANSLRLAAETTPSASAFVNAPLVSYITSVGWAAGKRPGISFWGDAYSGAFLYFDGSLTFKAINDAGLSMTFASTAYVLANQPWAISGSNISYTAGNVGIGTSTLGTTTQLTIGGAQTASSAIARGILLNTSLTQSIANDVLTAVQITPTLSVNNTLFHEAYWLRLTGSYTPASYTSNNNATTIDLSNSFTNTFNAIGIRIRHTYGNVQNGYGILLESAGFIGIAQTSSTSNNFFAGTTIIGNSVTAPASGYTLHVTNNTNGAIKIGSVSQGSEHLIISHSQAGATFSSIRSTFINTGAQMQISVGGQDNLRLFGTGNVTVGGTTDAGYKLDVNGTTRIQGNTTLTGTLTMGNGSFSYSANPNNWFTISGNQGLILNQANGNVGSIVLGASNSANFTVALTNTTMYGVSISRPVTPIAGSTNLTYNSLEIDNVINYTNATNSIVRGLYIHPTLTSVTDFRAIETTVGNVLFGTTSGNVGIGTTNPIYNLEINNSTGYVGVGIRSAQNNNAELSFQNAGYPTPRWTIRASAAANGSSGNLVFQRNASTFPMSITSGDNVLIGTSIDAGYKLDVNGTGRFVNTLNLDSNLTFGANDIVINSTKVFGKLSIYGTASALSAISIGYNSTASNNSSVSIGYNSQNSGDRAVTIGADTSSNAANSVAIGRGSVGVTDSFVSGSNSGTITDVYFGSGARHATANTAGVEYRINGSGASNNFNIAGGNIIIAGGKGTGTGTPGDVIFATSSLLGSSLTLQSLTNRVWIKGDSGNVGIGTTTPTALLEVNGSARIQNGLTVSGSLNLNSSDISSAWTTYTPTWSTDGATQPSLGDGTITGAYKVIGKTVFVRVRLVFGTTTTAGTGAFYFSLPVSAAAAWGIQMPVSILDNGNAWYQATVNGEYGGFTDRVALITQSAGGANSSQGVTGVFPITFANTDSIQFNGSYESA